MIEVQQFTDNQPTLKHAVVIHTTKFKHSFCMMVAGPSRSGMGRAFAARMLARQIFPTDWRRILEFCDRETNRPYGHVILDSSTPVKYETIVQQYYNLLNPYDEQLLKARQSVTDALNEPNASAFG